MPLGKTAAHGASEPRPNIVTAIAELAWLEAVIDIRFAPYSKSGVPTVPGTAAIPPPPKLSRGDGPYADLVRKLAAGPAERLVLALALAPHMAPELLDPFFLLNAATGRRFAEFGGLIGQSHAGFLPTAQTALFLLAGDELAARIAHQLVFSPASSLLRHGTVLIEHRHPDEPPMAAGLRLSARGLHDLLHGGEYAPPPSSDFPATLITTPLEWDDLVLDRVTREQVDVISLWIAHAKKLMVDWGLARRLKPGYRCLFHGEPGTGKTLTASLLGKLHGLPVYRVDISRVVSKWIGETEKNLAALFDQAEDRNWILFFDEADALFGRRTESNSANDRSANQQIAYLLQRLEIYSGIAILATNQHGHLDEAFARRFQASVRFGMPDAAARSRLWRDNFAGVPVAADVDFDKLAKQNELAGGSIINVLRHAALLATRRRPAVVHAVDLMDGVRLELRKEGQYLSR